MTDSNLLGVPEETFQNNEEDLAIQSRPKRGSDDEGLDEVVNF